VGCWCGYLSGARCILAYGPADATATVSCSCKIQIVCTFLGGRMDGWMVGEISEIV